ncbi:MAG: SDR family oxidoreductase [Proteobacteria bacterium]|nr:SDR family oxidoreductase [Pseudomonadota bacterium]
MKNNSSPVFLVTGASGFVGSRLCLHLAPRCTVVGACCSHPVCLPDCRIIALDITDREQVHAAVRAVRPTHIIHAAAISAPDICERNPQAAWDINCTGTQNIIDAASASGSRVVFISTDLVFDGRHGNYAETSLPNPINMYARTKVEAEKLCLKTSLNCLVVRITLQYGFSRGRGSSFSDWLIQKLSQGLEAPLFTDQFRSPTCVMDTARGLELSALHGSPGELYHLAGPERIDRYGFAQKLASVFNLPEHLLKPCSMEDVHTVAPRPADVSLCGKKFTERFHFSPSGILDGLKAMNHENTATI